MLCANALQVSFADQLRWYLAERGAIGGLGCPALEHDGVNVVGTLVGFLHAVTIHHFV